VTTPPDSPLSVGPTPDEVSSRPRHAADSALAPTRPALQQPLRYRLLARDELADPSAWDRRAYAAQVATALDTTESLADAFMAGDLSTLDQALAPTFCWWSVTRHSGDGAPTGMPRPLEPLATRSTFLALARRWRYAFGDLVIALGPSLIETEDRLLRQSNPQALAHGCTHMLPAGDECEAAPATGATVAIPPMAQPRPMRRRALLAGAADDPETSRLSALVTVSWSATARHTGPLGRFPATGASLRLAGVAHLRFDATSQVTHFATRCDTPFWRQLPGLTGRAGREPSAAQPISTTSTA